MMWGTWFRLFLIDSALLCAAVKFTYISTERPELTYINQKYLENPKITCRRYSRSDPFYYVSSSVSTKVPIGNNVTADFVFYEFLSNQYKRSFVEMHYKVCDLVQNELFLGMHLKQGEFLKPCPYAAGLYTLHNQTVPVKRIPSNFPFRKGRIEINFTITETHEVIASGHIDMELKEANIRTRKNP